MVLFLPVGVEGATLRRLPWASLGLAGACALVFLATWVFAQDPERAGYDELVEAVEYWDEHPYLILPDAIADRLEPSLAARRRAGREASASPLDEDLLRAEQGALDALAKAAESAFDKSALRRFALVPARGPLQVGLLTHMFLHWGWMHLLGNFLFFYLVGPLLEQAWGRWQFLSFYVLGGLLAGLAHFGMDRHSSVSMVGASGAIAACIGAFTVRYAGKRIRIGYLVFLLIRFWRGSFSVPAWLWGGLWIASELWNWRASASGGVAVAAHVAGFGFGFALAVALKAGRYGESEDAHEHEDVAWVQHGGVAQAEAALRRDDAAGAEAALREVLAQEPGNAQALLALGKLELAAGRRESGMGRVDRLLRQQLASPSGVEAAPAAIAELGPLFDAALLSPGVALRLGGALERGPEGLRPMALEAYLSAAKASGPAGAKAHLRAAAVRLARRDPPEEIEAHLEAASAVPELAAEVAALRAQLAESAASLPRAWGPGAPNGSESRCETRSCVAEAGTRTASSAALLEAAQTAQRAAQSTRLPAAGSKCASQQALRTVRCSRAAVQVPTAPRIVGCRLLEVGAEALRVEVEGRASDLALRRVVGVAVGLVPGAQPGRSQLLTDLILSWGGAGQGAAVLRLDGQSLALGKHYPGVPSRQAFAALLSHVIERSGARPMFDGAALSSFAFPRFEGLEALDAAFYGAVG
jgi:membrane associated rhomboid family serine protease